MRLTNLTAFLNMSGICPRRISLRKNDGERELTRGRRYKIPTRYQLTQSILIGVQCIFGLGDGLSLMARQATKIDFLSGKTQQTSFVFSYFTHLSIGFSLLRVILQVIYALEIRKRIFSTGTKSYRIYFPQW